jgi:hypothetical protein
MIRSFLSRTRRNHGLEHATLNLLAKSHPGKAYSGHSDGGGFWVIGEIPTEILESTVMEALSRLKAGQSGLAVHPYCGTNLLVSGFAAGVAGSAGLIGAGKRPADKLERVPLITLFSVLALIAARPLGPVIQKKVTTSGDPGALKIHSINKHKINGLPAHRVKTVE